MIKRQFEVMLQFERAPVQLVVDGKDLETVGGSYRANATISYLGEGECKADITSVESRAPFGSKRWSVKGDWVKDHLPIDEIEKLEECLVEYYEEEMEEV